MGAVLPYAAIIAVNGMDSETSLADSWEEMYVFHYGKDAPYLLDALNAVPFILLSITLEIISLFISSRRLWFLFIFGMTGILIISITGHVGVWWGIHKNLPGASTDVIAFYILPFVSIISMTLFLLIGSGCLWIKFREKKKL